MLGSDKLPTLILQNLNAEQVGRTIIITSTDFYKYFLSAVAMGLNKAEQTCPRLVFQHACLDQ